MIAQKVANREPEVATREAVEARQIKKGDLLVVALEKGSWKVRGQSEKGFGLGRVTRFDRQDGMPYVELVGNTNYITGSSSGVNKKGTEIKPKMDNISNHPYERLVGEDSMVPVTRLEDMKEMAARGLGPYVQKLAKDNLILSGKDVAIIKDVSVRDKFLGGQEIQTVKAEFLAGANAGRVVEFDAKKGKQIA